MSLYAKVPSQRRRRLWVFERKNEGVPPDSGHRHDIERGLKALTDALGDERTSELLFSRPNHAIDRLFVSVVNDRKAVAIISSGMITPREGEVVAYLISASLLGILCDRAFPPDEGEAPPEP